MRLRWVSVLAAERVGPFRGEACRGAWVHHPRACRLMVSCGYIGAHVPGAPFRGGAPASWCPTAGRSELFAPTGTSLAYFERDRVPDCEPADTGTAPRW